MIIEDAIYEAVNAAYKRHGGKGTTDARILRPRKARKDTNNMQQIYIAGAISKIDFEEAEALFMAAEIKIRHHGHEPLNPITLVDQDDEKTWEDYMIECLEIVLCSATALYMLPNWRESRGARVEHATAVELGLPIYYAETGF